MARSFSGDAKQMVPLIKAGLSHKGLAIMDVISPCMTFNNHEGSTKSYKYVQDHDKPIHAIDFIEAQPEITADYAEGATKVIGLPDGTHIVLKKLERDYDPTDKAAAFEAIEKSHREGILLTGLLYIDEKKHDLNTMLNLVDTPLWAMKEADTRPSKAVLDQIMAGYR